jgi:hypothetical protein
MLPYVTQVRGFEPDRSLRIFRAKKTSAFLPSEGAQSRLSLVTSFQHVKELDNGVEVALFRLFLAQNFSFR